MNNVEKKTQKRVQIGDAFTTLATYELRGQDVEVMAVEWRFDGVPVRATAFNPSPNPRYRITADEFVAFLANVR
jgi:hypothetical protein